MGAEEYKQGREKRAERGDDKIKDTWTDCEMRSTSKGLARYAEKTPWCGERIILYCVPIIRHP